MTETAPAFGIVHSEILKSSPLDEHDENLKIMDENDIPDSEHESNNTSPMVASHSVGLFLSSVILLFLEIYHIFILVIFIMWKYHSY